MNGWRWISRHRVVSALLALGLVAAVVGSLLVYGPHADQDADPGAQAWAPWPTRGDLATDSELVSAAEELVARSTSAPGTRVLWIGRLTQEDKALAFVAVETGKVPTGPGPAFTASLHKVDIVPSTGLVQRGLDSEKAFRTSDLGIEVPELIDAVPRPDSSGGHFPVLTALGVDKVEFYRDTGVVVADIRADGVAHPAKQPSQPTPELTRRGCQEPVALVTPRSGQVQALQYRQPAAQMRPHGSVRDGNEQDRLLVSLVSGLKCRNSRDGDGGYALVDMEQMVSGRDWLGDLGPYNVFAITLLRTDAGDNEQRAKQRWESLAIAFPTGTPAIVGDPQEYDYDFYNPIAVKVSGKDLGTGDAVLTMKHARRMPVTVPTMPVQLDDAVILFGPHSAPVTVVHFDLNGDPASAVIVR